MMGFILRKPAILRGSAVTAIVATAVSILGCRESSSRQPQPRTQPQTREALDTSAQVGEFLAALEAIDGTAPAPLEAVAREKGIAVPPSVSAWSNLLNQSLHRNWRSRPRLVILAKEWREPYVSRAFEVYSERADAFTEVLLLDVMIEVIPEDKKTAAYALSLARRLPGVAWPDTLDLHGVRPFDAVARDSLPKVWVVPEELDHSAHEAACVNWAQEAAERRSQWKFDTATKKWRVMATAEPSTFPAAKR